jgi:hypothetical protein
MLAPYLFKTATQIRRVLGADSGRMVEHLKELAQIRKAGEEMPSAPPLVSLIGRTGREP